MPQPTSSASFLRRHIGVSESDLADMLQTIGVDSLATLIDETVPDSIRNREELRLPEAVSEQQYLRELRTIADRNEVYRSYIGLGYYGTHSPSVIVRNIFHNPGWYTQYTPYQAEIAQGRLEALLNFQTTVSDLTGLPIANASLLDEATAAAEAMTMFFGLKNKRSRNQVMNEFLVSDQVLPQTLAVLRTRAEPLGIEVKVQSHTDFAFTDKTFGLLLQYPGADGAVHDYRELAMRANAEDVYVTVAADLLALTLLMPPGEWGADAVVGNSQRFGVPLGYGGPHAGYFAIKDAYKRQMPGRIIGISVDIKGKTALRMALQTREQHIRREKATSNICTAQALLAIMAGMYAVWHGPEGLTAIAKKIHQQAIYLAKAARELGYTVSHDQFFDTIRLEMSGKLLGKVRTEALAKRINFYYDDKAVQVSLDETVSTSDLHDILTVLGRAQGVERDGDPFAETHDYGPVIAEPLLRTTTFLDHSIFQAYRSETEMMRYIKSLENKDLSLMHAMIPLGSCTMKLNAATELMPVSWSAFADMHPFAPAAQAVGYRQIFTELEDYLSEITGFAACSLQPNSGAQGEYAGLLTIRAYHLANGDTERTVAIIPSSAHGTNPASAVMAGMEVVVTACDDDGNIDLDDLRDKVEQHSDRLGALMITYPSTHGVFETDIQTICRLIHEHGGLVYMDGANMNAQVGLTSPGHIGADVCHLNLHKTFAIPHGGGGPGMGPICVNEKLKPFLPKHPLQETGGEQGISAVSAAPYGSPSILLISYGYIRMLGRTGLKAATEYAILNANYLRVRLQESFDVLYVGHKGHSAHELIVDLRPFKSVASAADVAKRLIDFGFHAPTMSWPVVGTIMIEPTESESKEELDRFCEAMIQIRREMDAVADGSADAKNNVLVNAPHTLADLTADEWDRPYTRSAAAWPLEYLRAGHKFWASVNRIDDAFGDRNLICTCPPVEAYAKEQ